MGLKKIKVGHCGTLDPLASGLIIICTGKMTKQIHTYQNLSKQYLTKIQFGFNTPSYDLETQKNETFPIENLTIEDIKSTIESFKGHSLQTPPPFSAVKVNGKRAYSLARKNIDMHLKAKPIYIDDICIKDISIPFAEFYIDCSKGTYIRSIAYDIGKKLKCGATVIALKRTKIGQLRLEDSITIEQFQKKIDAI